PGILWGSSLPVETSNRSVIRFSSERQIQLFSRKTPASKAPQTPSLQPETDEIKPGESPAQEGRECPATAALPDRQHRAGLMHDPPASALHSERVSPSRGGGFRLHSQLRCPGGCHRGRPEGPGCT